jgi:hypothetical protein
MQDRNGRKGREDTGGKTRSEEETVREVHTDSSGN